MRTVMLVPYRPVDPARARAWEYVQHYYAELDADGYLADSGDKPFSRSRSRNLAAKVADEDPDARKPWDVAVILDADCIVDLDVIRDAIATAYATGLLILPHDGYLPLTEAQTAALYDGTGKLPPTNRLYLPRHAPSGVVVIPRGLWTALTLPGCTGAYDERFVGWGSEDSDLLTRYMTLTGRKVDTDRLHARITHLWHPQSKPGA